MRAGLKAVIGSVMVVAGMLAEGCAGRQETGAPPSLQGVAYPDWVLKGSGAFGDEHARYFYGVGTVSGIRNVALARTTADNRARAEIAKVFETYSASLMKDYQASTTAGDPSVSSEEQNVEQAIKTFSAATLSGVQVVDHWYHPNDGSVFALAKLDLEGFKDNLNKMRDLNERVRDYVRQNAERAHQSLEKEEEKRGLMAPSTAAP